MLVFKSLATVGGFRNRLSVTDRHIDDNYRKQQEFVHKIIAGAILDQ